MSPWIVACLAGWGLFIAIASNNRDRQTFCLLWAGVLIAWSLFDHYYGYWFAAQAFTWIQHTLAYTAYFAVGFILNLCLLLYIKFFETDYNLIFYPIAFYAVLCFLAPIEQLLTETTFSYTVFIASAATVNTIELFLLAADNHGTRKLRKRWLSAHFIALRPLSAGQVPDNSR